MPEIDINFFYERHRLRNEDIIAAEDCRISGNPFNGSLILTGKRLIFIRKEQPGATIHHIRLSNVQSIDYRIENSVNFIMLVLLPEYEEQFQILAMDNARQIEFLKLAQLQVERRKLLDEDIGKDSLQPASETKNQNHS